VDHHFFHDDLAGRCGIDDVPKAFDKQANAVSLELLMDKGALPAKFLFDVVERAPDFVKLYGVVRSERPQNVSLYEIEK